MKWSTRCEVVTSHCRNDGVAHVGGAGGAAQVGGPRRAGLQHGGHCGAHCRRGLAQAQVAHGATHYVENALRYRAGLKRVD